jgi:drug/metabolite transporter (DMT)-like permease
MTIDPKTKPPTLAYIALAATSLIWGTTWLVSKKGVEVMPALQLAGIRQLIGGSLYLLYFMFRGWQWPTKSDWGVIIVLAILNFVMSNGLSTWGVKYISSGLGCILGAIYPLWLVVWAFFADKVKPPKLSVLGMILGFCGICVIFYQYLGDLVKPEFRFGIFLSIIATITWAAGTIITRNHAKKFSPYQGLGLQMIIAGFMLTTISFGDPGYTPITEIPSISWFAIFYLVIMGSILGFGAFLYTIQYLPTEQAAIYAYINPIVAMVVGSWIGNEPLTWALVIGAMVTVLGVYWVNKGFTNKAKLST